MRVEQGASPRITSEQFVCIVNVNDGCSHRSMDETNDTVEHLTKDVLRRKHRRHAYNYPGRFSDCIGYPSSPNVKYTIQGLRVVPTLVEPLVVLQQ